MNLYCVYPKLDEWCCFIFAETPSKAKHMLTNYFTNDDSYTDYRYNTIVKDTGGEPEVCDIDCERLKKNRSRI